jgi:hypothetical protein
MSRAQASMLAEPEIEQQPEVIESTGAAAPADESLRTNTMRTLLSVMMLGQLMGFKDDAQRVFDVMAVFLGDKNELRISLALASALAGDPLPAKALLSEGLDEWASPEMSKLALAMALKQAGDPDWESLPQHMLAASTDTEVREFARRLLAPPEAHA